LELKKFLRKNLAFAQHLALRYTKNGWY